MVSSYTPWKHQKTIGFLMFSGSIKEVSGMKFANDSFSYNTVTSQLTGFLSFFLSFKSTSYWKSSWKITLVRRCKARVRILKVQVKLWNRKFKYKNHRYKKQFRENKVNIFKGTPPEWTKVLLTPSLGDHMAK